MRLISRHYSNRLLLLHMAKENIAELALEFGRATAEMKNFLRQNIQVKIKEHNLDISFELLEIMALLWRKDGMNQQELADKVIKDKSSMTYLIDNLVKRNLVTRVEHETDRRHKLIFITEEGKKLEEKLHPWVIEMYRKATDEIDAAEIDKAISLVRKMNDNLKK
jgi:DNA-binding MarR family transcriptional regulator